MIENKRFILTEQFVTLQGITFVKDDNAYVDTYYTVGGAVDLLNELNNQADAVREELRLCEEENTELQKENEKLKFQNSNLMKEVAEYSRKAKVERCIAMKLGRECDNLTIKNQKLELEIIRLEEIIKTGKR